ncbi:hypothetical protein AMECASPLE_013952 [Ameca splendens]|uniref:Uncharacterized protein n=1 Tax=Ameca splendens TaxID=208324 RepID=A0ABV0ZB34_9TELE
MRKVKHSPFTQLTSSSQQLGGGSSQKLHCRFNCTLVRFKPYILKASKFAYHSAHYTTILHFGLHGNVPEALLHPNEKVLVLIPSLSVLHFLSVHMWIVSD